MSEQKQPDGKKEVNNLLSNVSPPVSLPNFVTNSAMAEKTKTTTQQQEMTELQNEPFIQGTFSAAIPPSKDTANTSVEETGKMISSNLDKMTLNPEPVASALDPITQSGSSLMSWMKEAVSTSGILHKVAETARNSVDTIVTTLDPQMKDYIYSSGDIELIVASDKDEKIKPIREAFHACFGRASVTGLNSQPQNLAAQPVGFDAALTAADSRIKEIRQSTNVTTHNLPVISIENFIVEVFPDQWFDAGFILLNDQSRNIILSTITQFTPIPATVITSIRADTSENYEFKDTGFAVTVGNIMANNLETHHSEWHKTYTSVKRSDMIASAAKTLAYLYKKALSETIENVK